MAGTAPEIDATANGAVANGVTDVGIVETPKVSGRWTVDKALDTITTGKPVEGSTSPVPYFHMLERLKTTKREGWKRFGIDRAESISDHMYRMSLMTMLCPSKLAARLDMAKCMKMCLIHDMAESLVGDIAPVDGVPKPEKSRREVETMDYITQRLLGSVEGGDVGKAIRDIWQEYEDSKTLESHFVHDIDKMELLLQMVEYEKRGQGKLDLGEFAYVIGTQMKMRRKRMNRSRRMKTNVSTRVGGQSCVVCGLALNVAMQDTGQYFGVKGADVSHVRTAGMSTGEAATPSRALFGGLFGAFLGILIRSLGL